MHAETLRIDLPLLFEKREPATTAKREQIPIVVSWVFVVLEELLRSWQHGVVTLHIELRWIDDAPVRVRIARLRAFGRIERRNAIAATSPVH